MLSAILVALGAAQISGDVVERAEPVAAAAIAVAPGESTARAIFRGRADAVVELATSDGQGSGTLIRADGFVLTCAHVVGDDTKVTVIFRDGRSEDGTVV